MLGWASSSLIGLLPVLIGLLWGVTNPLIRRGALVAARSPACRLTGVAALDQLVHHLLTPAFLAPQLANLAASALFAWCLGCAHISVVAPVANGVSLAANAVLDHALGDTLRPALGLPGLLLVFVGVTLCTLSAPASS